MFIARNQIGWTMYCLDSACFGKKKEKSVIVQNDNAKGHCEKPNQEKTSNLMRNNITPWQDQNYTIICEFRFPVENEPIIMLDTKLPIFQDESLYIYPARV